MLTRRAKNFLKRRRRREAGQLVAVPCNVFSFVCCVLSVCGKKTQITKKSSYSGSLRRFLSNFLSRLEKNSISIAYDHTALKTPDLVRSPQLSNAGPG